MKKRWTYAFGVVLLLAFAGFSLASFRDTLTPYVGYELARDTASRTVQVAGGLVAGSSSYDESSGILHFTLSEEQTEATMPVQYEGIKPANFEEAVSIVAIGRFDETSGAFMADKLLVKCPSKYQGAEVKEYS